jgi:hypothetical protein
MWHLVKHKRMVSVIMSLYIECHIAECRCVEYCYAERHFAEFIYAGACMLRAVMPCFNKLAVIILSVIILSVIMLSVVVLKVVMQNVRTLSTILMSIIMLSVCMLSITMPYVILKSVFMLSALHSVSL